MQTHEGGTQHEHSLNHAVEFFSKAGSLFEKRRNFYEGSESALSLFQKTWIVDKALSMKLLFWLRDCRGGAGNRSAFRTCLNWLAQRDPEWVKANLSLIVVHGRWDDMRALYGTPVQGDAAQLWAYGISKGDVLAAKWADRKKDTPVKHVFGMKVADFRRFLASIRKDFIVEHKMCSGRWGDIDYSKVPSLAMARLTNAFTKHDERRFTLYKEALASGETTVHAGVLFPHDCVRTAQHGDPDIADAQFKALPNFLEDCGERIIVVSDTSRSMDDTVSGSIRAVDVSQGMALYCSAKIPHDNPFHKKFLSFDQRSDLRDWSGMSFSEAVHNHAIFKHAWGSTRIDSALLLILKTAKFFSLTQEQMPTTLLIVSDMQFHSGVLGSGSEVEKCILQFEICGYEAPKVVYWNTSSYAGQPATVDMPNTGLVSGFSPAILKAIFSGTDFSPESIMLRALEKYTVQIPKGYEK